MGKLFGWRELRVNTLDKNWVLRDWGTQGLGDLVESSAWGGTDIAARFTAVFAQHRA